MKIKQIKIIDIVTLFLILFIILVSFFINNSLTYKDICISQKNSSSNLLNSTKNFEKYNFYCLSKFIQENHNSELCKNLSINSSICFKKIANILNNSSLCLKIKDSHTKEECLLILAFKNNESSLCHLLKNNTECYYTFAIKKADISVCNYALDKSLCIYSYALKMKNITLCESLSEKYKKDCLYSILNEND